MPGPYAVAHEGTVTLSGNIFLSVARAQIYKRHLLINTTEAGSARNPYYDAGRFFYWVDCELAWFRTDQTTYPHPYNSTDVNSLIDYPTGASIVRTIDLLNTTSSTDARGTAHYSQGVIDYQGRLRGWHSASGIDAFTSTTLLDRSSLLVPLSSTCHFQSTGVWYGDMRKVGNFTRGNAVLVDSDWRSSSTGTITTTNTPFAVNSSTSAVFEMASTADLSSVSGELVFRRLSCTIDYTAGTAVPFKFQGFFTGAVTVA